MKKTNMSKEVPALVSLGLRVIVPDMLGYGGTDAPEKLEEYSYKSVINDLVALVRHVLREAGHKDPESEKIILGGHDWFVISPPPFPPSLTLPIIP